MLQTEIKRIKLAASPAFEEGQLPSVAEDAKELLGYSPIITYEQEREDALLSTLKKLEIDILDWRDVRRYQMERKQEREWELFQPLVAENVDHPLYRWQDLPACGWREEELSCYKERVPPHVLLKAIQIKRELPEALFFVEYLEDTRDPFLFVTMTHKKWDDKAHYYIEVWEEPKFEGRG